jgi:RNA polymerase sigma-70 factor (ECF subfamily)
VDLPQGTAGSAAEQQPDEPRVASDVDVQLSPVTRSQPVEAVVRDADGVVAAAFEAHQRELFSFLARGARDDAEAEDLLQETFLRLAREVQAGREPEQVRAWLYRVGANLLTSRFRRRSVARRFLERFGGSERDEGHVQALEAAYLDTERYREMEQALGVLSTEARAALLLAAQGFTGREIAGHLGKSEVATRALLCRARLRVRAALEGGER